MRHFPLDSPFFRAITGLTLLAFAGVGQGCGRPVDEMSLEALRQQRNELAGRQRRIIMNNDGCDVMYFPDTDPATTENPLVEAMASATEKVPEEKSSTSKTPIGPFQNTLSAPPITAPNMAETTGSPPNWIRSSSRTHGSTSLPLRPKASL